jgi:hypothetical protein
VRWRGSLDDLGVGDGIGSPAVVGLAGELEYPARHRDGDPVGGELVHEGRAFSRQIGPRQVGGCPAQDFILLLQQSVSASQLVQLRRITGALAGLGAFVDIGLAHPLGQRHRVDTEIGRDLLDRHTVVAVARNPDDVVTELTGVRPGHNDILPGRLYCIIDWEQGIRGPEDLIFGMGAETDEQCVEMLERVTSGESGVSRRRDLPINIVKYSNPTLNETFAKPKQLDSAA